MSIAPGILVPAPTIEKRAGELIDAIQWATDSSERWQGGVSYEDVLRGHTIGLLGDPTCDGVPGLPKDLSRKGRASEVDGASFTVFGAFNCGPVGNTPEDANGLALQRLLAFENRALERAIFDETEAVAMPNVSDIEEVSVGTELKTRHALATLDREFATRYPGNGVLVIGIRAALDLANVLDIDGNVIRTKTGHRVVVIPSLADGEMMLLPPIIGYRSEVFNSSTRSGDLLDRTVNNLYAVAEKTFVIVFDPSVAVRTTFTPTD